MDTITLPKYTQDPVYGAPWRIREVNGVPQTIKGVLKRASKAYRTTDPQDVANKLTTAGFTVTGARSLYSSGPFRRGAYGHTSPWRTGLEVMYPGPCSRAPRSNQDEYADRARILLAHNGRESLKIALGAIRLACTNQFAGAVISIHHTNPEIDHFTADPAAVLMAMRHLCGDTVSRIETLHGVPFNGYLLDAMAPAKRLHRSTRNELWHYLEPDTVGTGRTATAWSLIQALTATRSPRAIRGAALLLDDPDYWTRGSVTGTPFAELFARN